MPPRETKQSTLLLLLLTCEGYHDGNGDPGHPGHAHVDVVLDLVELQQREREDELKTKTLICGSLAHGVGGDIDDDDHDEADDADGVQSRLDALCDDAREN